MSTKPEQELELIAARVADAMPTLTLDEQRLAIALYRQLAEGAPVAPERLASHLRAPASWVEETLARWPGVYRDEQGSVIGFWGLAQRPMPPHRLHVEGRELSTWCAWDSLVIPTILGTSARVESVCATTGAPISAEMTPRGVTAVSPSDAVISFLRPEAEFDEDVIVSFCHHVLFFSSQASGEEWTASRPDAFLLTLEQGFELGRLVLEATYRETFEALDAVA